MRVAICRVWADPIQCTIGNSDTSELNEGSDQMFYLDIDNEATCNGTITNWTVCYYGTDLRSGSYWATYAVYRRGSGVNSGSFERVSETFRALRATLGTPDPFDIIDGTISEGFNCYTDVDSIDAGPSPLTIQAGDIIGACVVNPLGGSLRELNIVGEASEESLMGADLDCTENAIPTIPAIIQQIDLQPQSDRRLHIYANVEPDSKNTIACSR